MFVARHLLIGAALLYFIGVVLWPRQANVESSTPEHSEAENLYRPATTKANLGLVGVRFYETNEGKKKWQIRSETGELHRKENYAFLREVDANFFAANTGNIVNALSRFGFAYTDRNWVRLEENVRVRSRRGYLFTMNTLDYNGKQHEFLSKDFVQMKGPDVDRPSMILRGRGLIADIDHEHFIVQEKVVAERRLKSGETLRLTSKMGEFFTEDQRAIFIEKVRATMPQIRIESDLFELDMANDSESLLARGNVILHNKDRIGRAESAHLKSGNSQIMLEGKARVDTRQNQVRGRRIMIYSDDDRIEVEQAQGTMKP